MAVDVTDTDQYPIGTDNLFVLQDNASVLDNVVNGEDDSYENRAGNMLRSLSSLDEVFDSAEISAAEAAASAGEASTSESNASGSESNASSSAAGASDSADAAAASAAAALVSENNASDSADDAAASAASIGTLGTAAYLDSGTGSDDVPQNSDLGTTAYEDVTTSNTDFTDGRVTKVGDGGIFSEDGQSGTYISDWDAMTSSDVVSGESVYQDSSTLNGPVGSFASGVITKPASARCWVEFKPVVDNVTYKRKYDSTGPLTDWLKEFDSGTVSTSTEINTGTSDDTVVTPLGLAGSEYGLGVNQTWQDVSASRAANTTYTNSTGKPIFVSVYRGSADNSAIITIDGIDIMTDNGDSGSGGSLSFIVPNGSTYSFNRSPIIWAELR